jgi:hypothetical protein
MDVWTWETCARAVDLGRRSSLYGTQPVDATSFTTCPVILGYMSSQAEMSKFRLEDVCLPAPLPDLGLALIK